MHPTTRYSPKCVEGVFLEVGPIQQANATPGADTINFAIPGTGVKTIKVGATGLGALPDITEQVTIDGYTQPGSPPTPRRSGTTQPSRSCSTGPALTATGSR
jgi:hypothetical protein